MIAKLFIDTMVFCHHEELFIPFLLSGFVLQQIM